jgi:hypothetical protein
MNRFMSTSELRCSERVFVAAMQRLGFGRFELLGINNGELVLDPWPTTVRGVKFGSEDPAGSLMILGEGEFQLKRQVIELFEYVRGIEAGKIRCLEVRHGLPFFMEVELAGVAPTEVEGGGIRDSR